MTAFTSPDRRRSHRLLSWSGRLAGMMLVGALLGAAGAMVGSTRQVASHRAVVEARTPRLGTSASPSVAAATPAPMQTAVMSDIDEIGFYPFIEALGYDTAWVADSQMIYSDVYMVLALAAQQTKRLRIGPGTAICGTRIAPVQVAAMALEQLVGMVFIVSGLADLAPMTYLLATAVVDLVAVAVELAVLVTAFPYFLRETV